MKAHSSTRPNPGQIPASSALGLWSAARLALGLLPNGQGRAALLTLLGAATSVLDTMAIGLVLMLLQFAFGAVEPVEGFGALGLLSNLAYQISRLDLWAIGAITFGILAAHSLLSTSYVALNSHVRLQAYQTFRERVFASWLERDLASDDRQGPGAIVNTIQNETWEAADAVFQYCILAIAGAITGVYLLVLLATSPLLTVIAGSLGLVSVAPVGRVRRRLSERSQISIDQKEQLARHLVGNLNGLRTLKAFRAERAAVERSHLLSSALRRTFADIVWLEAAIKPLTDVVNALVLGAILLAAWQLGYPGTVTLGFVIVLFRAQPKAQLVFQTLGKLARSQPSVVTVARAMQQEPRSDAGTERFRGLEREIRFEQVRYAYPRTSSPALCNVDLTLRRGEMTAVIGPSGAGKSTLVHLLLRFDEPQQGSISCDGIPLHRISRASWLERIAIAGQDIELIDGTIRENLQIADLQASESRLWHALEIAQAADVVRSLPGGLEAEVGSRGVSLSGGQRQRLCLARALLVDADLLILDEATNALDLTADLAIHARIRSEFPDRTVLVVAHRDAIAQQADRVVVMESGSIAPAQPEVLGRVDPAVSTSMSSARIA